MRIRTFILPMFAMLLAACNYAPFQQTTVIATAPDYTPLVLVFALFVFAALGVLAAAAIYATHNNQGSADYYIVPQKTRSIQATHDPNGVTELVLEAPRLGALDEHPDVVWAVANQRSCSPADAATAIQRGLVRITYMQAALPPGGAQ